MFQVRPGHMEGHGSLWFGLLWTVGLVNLSGWISDPECPSGVLLPI